MCKSMCHVHDRQKDELSRDSAFSEFLVQKKNSTTHTTIRKRVTLKS